MRSLPTGKDCLHERLPSGKTLRVTTATPVEKSTPAQIRAAAMELFANRGFEATTLQAVADVVGISKQAILHHFKSKEELHDAVLLELLAHWQRTLPLLLVSTGATKRRFEAVFSELVAFFEQNPARARLVLRELLDRPEATRRTLGDVIGPWMQAIGAYIRIGQERGVHRADVDVEAYLLEVFQLALVNVATANVTGVVLGDGLAGRDRFTRELARIAHTSLFSPRHVPHTGPSRATPKEGHRS